MEVLEGMGGWKTRCGQKWEALKGMGGWREVEPEKGAEGTKRAR